MYIFFHDREFSSEYVYTVSPFFTSSMENLLLAHTACVLNFYRHIVRINKPKKHVHGWKFDLQVSDSRNANNSVYFFANYGVEKFHVIKFFLP